MRFLWILPLASLLAATPPRSEAQKALLAKGYRFERAGWIYLHVPWTPFSDGSGSGALPLRPP